MKSKNTLAATGENTGAASSLLADEKRAAEHIAAAANFAKKDVDVSRFAEALFHDAPPEDVTSYAPEQLALIAQQAYRAGTVRKPGETAILVANLDWQKPDRHSETVLVAINDDMPFLFDSLVGEITAQGGRIRALFHPVLQLARDGSGKRSDRGALVRESTIVVLLDLIPDEASRDALADGAQAVFRQVRLAVRDWHKMTGHLKETIAALQASPPKISEEELNESVALLNWLGDNHFTFLGCRDYAYSEINGGRLDPIEGSGLGVLSDVETRVIRRGSDRGHLSPEVHAFLGEPHPLIITKSNERSLVHRRVHMDYVGVKLLDANGRLKGERRFVGLFTSGAYSRRPGEIPLLRLKVRHVRERANLAPDSHDGKALAHILDTYPRDELFQIGADELFAAAIGILRLGERPKVRAFLRFDQFDRFVSALVFVPRDRYDTNAREKIHDILAHAFDGRKSAATPTIDDSALARVHYIIGRNEGPRPLVDVHELETRIRDAIRTWDDGFASALIDAHGESDGYRLFKRHAAGFSARYRDAFAPDEAVRDLNELQELASRMNGLQLKARAYRTAQDGHSTLRLKLYLLGELLPLSASLPIFENLGFRVIAEDSYPISLFRGSEPGLEGAILDFVMVRADDGPAELSAMKARLEDAFHAIVSGTTESDGFNRLIVNGGLDWRQVTILRTAAKYLRQAGFAFSQDYVEQTLARNPDISSLIVELFLAANDPHLQDGREARTGTIRQRIDAALNDVPSLDDDRIIRRLRNVVECTLRTNYFQKGADGKAPSHLALKLDSQHLDDLPAPRPHVEIFVYAPDVEGVHLRFGKVARGGIRWSDRREDYRTEILGLVKAQQVKNAVIVPVGAKGGFFPKLLPVNAIREDVQAAGIAAYKTFIGALLDLTDNIHPDGSIVPPPDTLRHDDDDPYLVVAADKGTASFSDIANGIAEARGFWLGDAFASGGSRGYDHKKMGITARGAWEAVKRHFREMGRDIQTSPFTVVGVGDMSGDVFGNGMLLSKATRLLAAFDHRHIFVDPDPDAVTSWAERKRMFELPRSSWADYDAKLISKGGGVFSRGAKEIPLSPELRALTGLSGDKATPVELMKALLKVRVDLLWFGGIGTFVKASNQSNADVGDRANDVVRIDGRDVGATVIGEGANLGVTQLGRIEFAMRGGRINTDAIDNSAGVDTSDHEVNLKILFSGPLRRGEISQDARDRMLADMTDDVAKHVLADNYDQTLALSVAQSLGVRDLDGQARFIRDLERRGRLDRGVEFLPGDNELRKRATDEKPLTRPELAVLLAYAKLDLAAEILASDLPDDQHFVTELVSYFPPLAARTLRREMESHRLRREIITDVLTNRIVNLAGPVFVHRMKEISSASAARVARAFVIAEGTFGLSALKARIDGLDGRIPTDLQTAMYADIAEILRRLGLWFLVNVPANAELAAFIARYRGGVEMLRGTFSTLVSPYEAHDTEARIKQLLAAGVALDLAEDVAVLPLLGAAPEIAQLAFARSLDIDLVAGAYFAVGGIIGIDRLRGLASKIVALEHWDRLAIRRIVDDLFAGQRALTAQVLLPFEGDKTDTTREDGMKAARAWAEEHVDSIKRTRSFLDELERTGELSIAKLTLANSQIHELAAH